MRVMIEDRLEKVKAGNMAETERFYVYVYGAKRKYFVKRVVINGRNMDGEFKECLLDYVERIKLIDSTLHITVLGEYIKVLLKKGEL